MQMFNNYLNHILSKEISQTSNKSPENSEMENNIRNDGQEDRFYLPNG